MGSSTGNGEEVPEQPRSERPFPITEIRLSTPPKKPSFGFLRFLSYGLPWAAWLINVALLITPRYQRADVSLCIGRDLQQQLIDSGIANVTTQSALCEPRVYYLGVVQCSEEVLSSPSSFSVYNEVNELASDDLYNNLALGVSIIPVVLGCILICFCCGPVLLGEFAEGQSMLWNISTLVDFISTVFSGLTMLFLETNICQEQQICAVLQDNDRYSTVASSILGFNGAVSAVSTNGDEGNNFIAADCEQTCSADAGFYLSIVATALWLLAFVGTILLKKANAKIHP